MFKYYLELYDKEKECWVSLRRTNEYVYILNLYKVYSNLYPALHFRVIDILKIR